jgi:FkbM family methyltransferase
MRFWLWLATAFRAAIRLLMTDRRSISPTEKFVRACMLVPLFGSLLVMLRVVTAMVGPLRVEARTRDGDSIACDLPDLIQMYVYLFGVWEPDLAAFIRTRLASGHVFVDVGANIGIDTLIASRRVGPQGEVMAIEASPTVFERLRETLRANGSPTNVHAINKAVAANAGVLTIYAGPAHNIGLTTTVQRGGMRRSAEVQAQPLGAFLTDQEFDRVRLIKIDVEGAEDGVLQGMIPCLERLPAAAEIAVELSPLWWRNQGKAAAEVLRPFVESGFHVYTIDNNYWPWRYLWPNCVRRPMRLRDESVLTRPMKRLDVILSRVDADEL